MKKVFDCIKRNSFFILSAIVFTVFYCWYHDKIRVSSDNVTMLPFALDFLKGNFLLKGWVAGTNNFFFTETIFFLPGLALGISGIVLEAVISSIVMALLVVLMCRLFLRDKGVLFVLSYYAVVGIVTVGMSSTLINTNSHNTLYMIIVLELMLLFDYAENRRLRSMFIYMVIASLSLYSDSVTLMGLLAPVICLSAYMFIMKLKDKEQRMVWFVIADANVLSFIGGRLIGILIKNAKGLRTQGLPIQLTPGEEIPDRIEAWFGEIKGIWGYDYPGSSFIDGCYRVSIIAIMVIFAIAVLYYAYRIVKFDIEPKELLAWFVVVINLCGCIFTKVDVTVRYCAPSYLFGMILALLFISRVLAEIADKDVLMRGIAVIAVLFIISVSAPRIREIIKLKPYLDNDRAVAQYIRDKNLGTGYGQYWCGPLFAALVDYEYNVLPVYTGEDGFSRYVNLIKRSWYKEKDIHYTVSFVDDTVNDAVAFKNTDIIAFAGEPDWSEDINGYRIMYWDKDISDYLVK